jgi:hypothetical protein
MEFLFRTIEQQPIPSAMIACVVGVFIGAFASLLIEVVFAGSRRRQHSGDSGLADDNDYWMEYVNDEVRAVCHAKGWRHQIRRKWSVRQQPVSESTIEDYEWKLIPDENPASLDIDDTGYDGTYYVVHFDKSNRRFVLQHETCHVGIVGPHHELATFTEIQPRVERPPEGWLRMHLLGLVARYKPNRFCLT